MPPQMTLEGVGSPASTQGFAFAFDKFDGIILVHQACGIVHVDVRHWFSVFIGWDVIADRHQP